MYKMSAKDISRRTRKGHSMKRRSADNRRAEADSPSPSEPKPKRKGLKDTTRQDTVKTKRSLKTPIKVAEKVPRTEHCMKRRSAINRNQGESSSVPSNTKPEKSGIKDEAMPIESSSKEVDDKSSASMRKKHGKRRASDVNQHPVTSVPMSPIADVQNVDLKCFPNMPDEGKTSSVREKQKPKQEPNIAELHPVAARPVLSSKLDAESIKGDAMDVDSSMNITATKTDQCKEKEQDIQHIIDTNPQPDAGPITPISILDAKGDIMDVDSLVNMGADKITQDTNEEHGMQHTIAIDQQPIVIGPHSSILKLNTEGVKDETMDVDKSINTGGSNDENIDKEHDMQHTLAIDPQPNAAMPVSSILKSVTESVKGDTMDVDNSINMGADNSTHSIEKEHDMQLTLAFNPMSTAIGPAFPISKSDAESVKGDTMDIDSSINMEVIETNKSIDKERPMQQIIAIEPQPIAVEPDFPISKSECRSVEDDAMYIENLLNMDAVKMASSSSKHSIVTTPPSVARESMLPSSKSDCISVKEGTMDVESLLTLATEKTVFCMKEENDMQHPSIITLFPVTMAPLSPNSKSNHRSGREGTMDVENLLNLAADKTCMDQEYMQRSSLIDLPPTTTGPVSLSLESDCANGGTMDVNTSQKRTVNESVLDTSERHDMPCLSVIDPHPDNVNSVTPNLHPLNVDSSQNITDDKQSSSKGDENDMKGLSGSDPYRVEASPAFSNLKSDQTCIEDLNAASSLTSGDALQPDPELSRVTSLLFTQTNDNLDGEVTCWGDRYALLEEINRVTMTKSNDLRFLAVKLNRILTESSELGFDVKPLITRMHQIDTMVTKVEKNAYRLDDIVQQLKIRIVDMLET